MDTYLKRKLTFEEEQECNGNSDSELRHDDVREAIQRRAKLRKYASEYFHVGFLPYKGNSRNVSCVS
ncbi:SCAN domain-containing protein 3, partial [Biomphalaria glabrata]